MKKWIALLMALCLMLPAALADVPDVGLELTVNGMSLTDEWEEMAGDTHRFLVLDVTATNWRPETVALSEQISGQLTFMERYSFDAALSFPTDAIEPLVRLDGALVFRIPNMVAESLEETRMALRVEDRTLTPGIEISASSVKPLSGTYESEGFDTPEDAAKAYIDALNAGDMRALLSTFAIETYVDRMDRKAYIERLGIYNITVHESTPMPTQAVRDLLVAVRLGNIANRLIMQYQFYAWPDGYGEFDGSYVTFSSGDDQAAQIEEFLNSFGDADINRWPGNVAFVDFIRPEQLNKRYYEDRNQENLWRMAEIRGCSALEDLAIHFTACGVDYLQMLQCGRYDGRWFVTDLGGSTAMFLGLNDYHQGGLIPMSALNED